MVVWKNKVSEPGNLCPNFSLEVWQTGTHHTKLDKDVLDRERA